MVKAINVVMIGGTGAVGTECLKTLLQMSEVGRITLLGRRLHEDLTHEKLDQHIVDLGDTESYASLLTGHNIAICTLGVGEPTKVSKDVFIKVDKEIPLAFATACKNSGVEHFQLLSSVGVDDQSRSFFLRTKGELERGLRDLAFDRLSLFHPSMILTPQNRYGFSQALTLAVWPLLNPVLVGSLRKLRGIEVSKLGQAIAYNIFDSGISDSNKGIEILEWGEMTTLSSQSG